MKKVILELMVSDNLSMQDISTWLSFILDFHVNSVIAKGIHGGKIKEIKTK